MFIYVLRCAAQVARAGNVATLANLVAKEKRKVLSNEFDVTLTQVTAQDPSPDIQNLIKAPGFVDTEASLDGPSAPPLKAHVDLYKRLSRRTLSVQQVSNALKHMTALRMICETSSHYPDAAHVVLEDDVIFNERTVIETLKTTLAAAPVDADLVFLGLPSIHSGTPSGIIFDPLERVFKVLPCCDSYAITPKAAAAMLDAYLPLRFATQVHLSYLVATLGLRAFICSPSVFIDGSKLGVYMSSVEQNNALIWNPHWHRIRTIVSSSSSSSSSTSGTSGPVRLSEQEDAEIRELLSRASFKEHPDFRHLVAQVLTRQGKYREALAEYEAALDIYVAEKYPPLNSESSFMRDFIQLYKFLQEGDNLF